MFHYFIIGVICSYIDNGQNYQNYFVSIVIGRKFNQSSMSNLQRGVTHPTNELEVLRQKTHLILKQAQANLATIHNEQNETPKPTHNSKQEELHSLIINDSPDDSQRDSVDNTKL
jgi:hypothetical protein